jgi:multiple sugar transport system ATP-binding protein
MAKVTLNHVFKIYKGDKGKDVVAVDDFNLEVEDREFIVFVGPSGCGKSTTLIAGLEEISKGDVVIGDRRVNDIPPKDRDIAMVFQNYALYPHMSVRENLAFGLKLRKYPTAEIKKRVDDAAAILGLEPYLDRKPKALSGGQRQRVAVGRAIVRQPKVFLFDEPLSNLDAKMRVQMRTEITKLHQRLQATMIYVTHDQVEAMTMGDRIVVMKDGLVQQTAAPMEIYSRPANIFVATFVGSPQMNLLKGTLEDAPGGPIFRETGGTISCKLPQYAGVRPSGSEVVLGIRAENIALVKNPEAPAECRFQGVVDVVEPMGAETHIYVKTGEAHTIVCRSEAQIDHSIQGNCLDFQINTSKVHLFDPETTMRISER